MQCAECKAWNVNETLNWQFFVCSPSCASNEGTCLLDSRTREKNLHSSILLLHEHSSLLCVCFTVEHQQGIVYTIICAWVAHLLSSQLSLFCLLQRQPSVPSHLHISTFQITDFLDYTSSFPWSVDYYSMLLFFNVWFLLSQILRHSCRLWHF